MAAVARCIEKKAAAHLNACCNPFSSLPSGHQPALFNPQFRLHCYAVMARRSPPPVRRNADGNEELGSESESDSEEEENKMDLFDVDYEDDVGESEEWEGFTMDFGYIGKKGDYSDEGKDETA